MLSLLLGAVLFVYGASDWLQGEILPLWAWIAIVFGAALLVAGILRRPRRPSPPVLQSEQTFNDTGAILPYRSSLPQLASELARARRYQYPLTMVIIRLDQDRIAEKGNGLFSMKKTESGFMNLLLSFLGSLLRSSLRDIDIVSFDVTNSQYVVLLPETTMVKAERPVSRLNEMSLKQTGISLIVGMAEFPVDGLIIEDLVGSAEAACKHLSENGAVLTVSTRERQRSHSTHSVVQ